MKNKKVVILVMASSNPGFRNLEEGIKKTWFNLKNDNTDIIFYTDNQLDEVKYTQPVLQNDNLILPCNDGYYYCGLKTIMAFEWLLQNYDFEYIYRSNLGAFVWPDKILNFLEDKPKTNFYSGILLNDTYNLGFNVSYASGSGYFLSKDLVKKIVDNKDIWPHQAVDDVALGYVLNKFGISVDTRATGKILCLDESNRYYWQYNKGGVFVDFVSDDEIYHARLRHQDHLRYKDIAMMQELYNIETKKNTTDMIKLIYGGQDKFFTKEELLEPERHYKNLCNIQSDINEHLPTLRRYAEQCESVTEMGVRFACSTWAFIEAKPKKLNCIDINYEFFEPSEEYVREMCNVYNIEFNWITGDSLNMVLNETDLLFIDTLHTYNQLSGELDLHSKNVRKYIILHDTSTFGYRDESLYDHASEFVKNKNTTQVGLQPAVYEFLAKNQDWFIKEVFTNNNGLTVLARR